MTCVTYWCRRRRAFCGSHEPKECPECGHTDIERDWDEELDHFPDDD